MSRILLLGDSLGMPVGKDILIYDDTYPFLIKSILEEHEVISRHKRTNDTKKQLSGQCIFDDIEMINPDFMVVHLGIVDCAPRLFSRAENAILKMLPIYVRSRIINISSRYRYYLTKMFKKKYVSINEYQKNIELFEGLSKKNNINLIFIEIIKTNEINEKKSYRFKESIELYNSALLKACQVYKRPLVRYNYPNNYLLEDGIHLNKIGSKYIADRVVEIISSHLHD